jgi:hypothetical protein
MNRPDRLLNVCATGYASGKLPPISRHWQNQWHADGIFDGGKPHFFSRRTAFTLVEILVSTTLALLLLTAVIRMFGAVGEGITDARAMLESADRLRVAQTRLQQDLAGVTVTMNPPVRPEDNSGYFEYIEGPVGSAKLPPPPVTHPPELFLDHNKKLVPLMPSEVAVDSENSSPDTTVGDFDDILMFTTRSTGRPFVGKCGGGTIQSDVAEVAWFVRGRTLYRRVLLVAPASNPTNNPVNFYANNDVSVRVVCDPTDSTGNNKICLPNTLADLTRRECRYAHLPWFTLPNNNPPNYWPYGIRQWSWPLGPSGNRWGMPTLPTLMECSVSNWFSNWINNMPVYPVGPGFEYVDFWSNNPDLNMTNNALTGTANPGSRIADDVILTNVIGFDVKAWDPGAPIMGTTTNPIPPGSPPDSSGNATYIPDSGAIPIGFGAYVDLGYYPNYAPPANYPQPRFHHLGYDYGTLVLSATNAYPFRTYDTFSTHYENSGRFTGDGVAGISNNGFDDNTNGVVDDDTEKITIPPYPVPLRGIQVKIRVFEPDSRQIREVTVVQDFLPQ